LVEHQGQLFEVHPGVNEAEWGGLLNRLAIRLGEDNVVSAACVAGAQPERSVEYRSLVGPRSVRPRRSQQRLAGNVMDRPLRLFPEPIELSWPDTSGSVTLAKVAPGVSFGTPGNPSWSVQRCWGPERIETA